MSNDERPSPNGQFRLTQAEQEAADADQLAADSDRATSAADQVGSDSDALASTADQTSSDADQATADLDEAANVGRSHAEYQKSRATRLRGSVQRRIARDQRGRSTDARSRAARSRDEAAARRDEQAKARDERAAEIEKSIALVDPDAARKLERLRIRAVADRAAAARDRALAAGERETAAAERAALEAHLESAHLDDLTGAYRREMGSLAISHEIDRARRSDGRFVVAFVDVDDLKGINDHGGHAAGDLALQLVVGAIRAKVRSFDPILRYGGDEFVAGLSATDLPGAERRFRSIQEEVNRQSDVTFSLGFAALEPDDTADDLIARADRDMYRRRAERKPRAGSASGAG
jgi:diguanylate cyclase (GGDEF)-like protein